jgi:hypothetical protein
MCLSGCVPEVAQDGPLGVSLKHAVVLTAGFFFVRVTAGLVQSNYSLLGSADKLFQSSNYQVKPSVLNRSAHDYHKKFISILKFRTRLFTYYEKIGSGKNTHPIFLWLFYGGPYAVCGYFW